MPVSMLSTSLFSDRKSYSRFNALDTIYTPPSTSQPGMVLLTDYTITHAGTSATLTNGQVTFTAVTSLSLNGVFTADFDNYVISLRGTASGGSTIDFRLRAAGSDNSTASSYVYQRLEASATIIQAQRTTTDKGRLVADLVSTTAYGFSAQFYGPFLAQPTAVRNVAVSNAGGALISEFATTHNQSTSYDGVTFIATSNNITGAVQVYGVRS